MKNVSAHNSVAILIVSSPGTMQQMKANNYKLNNLSYSVSLKVRIDPHFISDLRKQDFVVGTHNIICNRICAFTFFIYTSIFVKFEYKYLKLTLFWNTTQFYVSLIYFDCAFMLLSSMYKVSQSSDESLLKYKCISKKQNREWRLVRALFQKALKNICCSKLCVVSLGQCFQWN